MVFLLNNSKVWVPIVIGIAFGVISMRNHKKSERHKRQWQDGGEIGAEVHDDHDQFLRLESGQGRIMIGEDKNNLDIDQVVEDDFAVFVPAGKWHNFVNEGSEPVKLYSIYAAPDHV
ncbi:cupin domain-containing protein [Corynebacterium striatum]|uniref:Cupin domain-containing protein n=1 Tax=Corynebacterium striatum TaxID=43770 RepID=A0ABX7DK32_CORST|nr:cupin domain-containing protein [Corynebacterium striatum]